MKIPRLTFRMTCCVAAVLGLLAVSPASGGRIKWSQPPDETAQGIDIRCDRNDGVTRVLADDFNCTTTGRITGVRLWGSWRKTMQKGKIVSIHLSIHADKPANPNDPASYSQPGDVLWERDFFAASITETLYRDLTYYEWWEDPYTGVIDAAGDNQIWQYDIAIKPDQAFRQKGTPDKPVIYWLAVYVKTDSGLFGWKTSTKHWSDNAIYRDTKGICQELIYPDQHPKKGQAIDLSFEISMPGLPHIALDTRDQWRDSLQRGSIVPFELSEWNLYMAQWSANLYPGLHPYPNNTFLSPTLEAFEGDLCGANNRLQSDGLLMRWGSASTPNGSYSSGWKYKYAEDPDLTNSVIAIGVHPPCGINVVSFGLKDINGKIRAWYWTALICGVANSITIDTSIVGPGAATPIASSFTNDPAFDITQVVEMLFDENWNWVANTGVPPPGQTLKQPWNYWYDLTVTPKIVKTIGPLKWSQPPAESSPGVFLGWGEESVSKDRPLMADDWLCKDPRPVTDIHWWGSFTGWMDPEEPPQMPTAFRLSIWTDVPKDDSTQPNTSSFSHPGQLVWEYECKDYEWNFAGFDKDPRTPQNPTGNVTVFEPTVRDSCFQFYCVLPEASWFYQQPTTFGSGRVYWLSIAAVYSATVTPEYRWGWKTRPHNYNDDAVRILATEDGVWPPNVGAKWLDGKPVEFPEQVSWDLCFELTTQKPEPILPFPDLDLDGIVNLRDFSILAENWMVMWP